jgi:hypothetical protein
MLNIFMFLTNSGLKGLPFKEYYAVINKLLITFCKYWVTHLYKGTMLPYLCIIIVCTSNNNVVANF